MHLLLIEDNDSISGMIAQYLRLKGHDCIVADNGKDGLAQILSNNYDVALLDLAMPEFSGYDVIESLETTGKLKEQKLIVLTASSITERIGKKGGVYMHKKTSSAKRPYESYSILR